jgi:RNA polymerase sigma-70 factor (ECF subfamily)
MRDNTTAINCLLALRTRELSPAAPSAVALLTWRLSKGEEEAFREFHALYFVRLHRFLLVVARGDEAQAQEALQETFLRVARQARIFQTEEVFWSWLRAVARNAARDASRKQRRYLSLLERFTRQKVQEVAGEVSLADILEETVAELDPDERRLIEGKYLEGESVRQLSEQEGLTEKAVESRLLRLRRELRERILRKLKTS